MFQTYGTLVPVVIHCATSASWRIVPLAPTLPNRIAIALEGQNICRRRVYVKGIVRETRLFKAKHLLRTLASRSYRVYTSFRLYGYQ